MVSFENVSRNFDYVFGDLYDERTKDMFPSITFFAPLLVSYVFFCKILGPALMRDKKPFGLKGFIFYYNIFQIIASYYIFHEGIIIWWNDYNWTCQPTIPGDTPLTRKIISLVSLYTNLKLIELIETVVFVLRKKKRQISGLHVYHHFIGPVCGFIGLKYYPTGHSQLLGVLNSFVHSIMYTYYLIAGLGPQYKKYLWWKSYVTVIQIVQFIMIFTHNMIPLFNGCDYPKWANALLAVCSLHFMYLFGKFYYKNYVVTPDKTDIKQANGHAKKLKSY